MDFEFEPTFKAKIKAFRARAIAAEIAHGTPADQVTMNADRICKHHWRDQVRKAEESRNTKARTLRRIIISELGDIL